MIDDIIIAIAGTFVLTCSISFFAIRAAWRNGVVDGYGYSREPTNPGYREAGKHLRKTMRHRWFSLGSNFCSHCDCDGDDEKEGLIHTAEDMGNGMGRTVLLCRKCYDAAGNRVR